MYEAMACARPLLLAVDGEARDLIERQAGAALYVPPENAAALAAAILRLRDDPSLAGTLGAQGRAFVAAHFDRNALAAALESRIAALLGQTTAKGPMAKRRDAIAAPERR
jgi:glycosyltransferase involved in cell wall biosynthesis